MRRKTPQSKKFGNAQKKRWSAQVMKHSNALDLDKSVFTWKNPRRIAHSLKRSAEKSTRRKTTPYASAMSMLNFYINRAGKNMSSEQKQIFQRTEGELRKVFHRPSRQSN